MEDGDIKNVFIYIFVVGGLFCFSVYSWLFISKALSVACFIVALVLGFASYVVKWGTNFMLENMGK